MKFGAVENKARLAILVLILSLLSLVALSLALFSRAGSELASSPIIIYLFSYQIIALVFGIGLVFLLIRWLLRPYRRMVEAARGSPVRASSAMSEGEFVAQTFQALVEQLQSKERELAQLHAVERRRAERSERFSERLVANIPSGLVTVDSRGLVTSVNAYAMKILGAAEPSARSAHVKQIQTGELLSPIVDYRTFFGASPKMASMISECLEKAKTFRREEVEIVSPGGSVARRIGLSISPISDASQNVEGALCLMTDLTEVIELRERMKLKENLANLGEMAAGLAHEFKNSLATIHGYVQLLDAQAVGPAPENDRRLTLDSVLNEVRLLSKLVTDFLNFARPQDLNLVKVDVRAIIDACIEEVESHLLDPTIEFSVEGEFPQLAGDETLLRRAFINLFRNAAEAIDAHSPRKRIVVSGAVDAGTDRRYAHIRVTDTGTGIAPEDLHRVFIPFFTTKSRGYGIGLALVQKIVVAHGGDVAVERSDTNGTVIHCRLPLLPPTASMEDE
ncbi:MAG TPA: ATP-binding protein [Blastocatellia bacterium]|nr:ATP-binding protein [Blastocatellia bacterium]